MPRSQPQQRETSPEELARASRDGDASSFERLLRRFSRRLLALGYRYCRDWESARDLCQETWIKVHEALSTYDVDRPFAPWLFAIHRNHCLSHLRKAARRRSIADGDGGPELILIARDDPGDGVRRREFAARLGAALGQLSRQQRRVFVLVDLEETAQKEAARQLGLAPGTVRATLHAARRRLAGLLTAREEIE